MGLGFQQHGKAPVGLIKGPCQLARVAVTAIGAPDRFASEIECAREGVTFHGVILRLGPDFHGCCVGTVLDGLAGRKYLFKVASHTCWGALVMDMEISGLVVEVRKERMTFHGLCLGDIAPFISLGGLFSCSTRSTARR